jgi:hypothetical protein
MKGYTKKKKTFFKPGNIPHNKGVRFLTDDTLPSSSAASAQVTRRMDADKFSLMAVTKPTGGVSSQLWHQTVMAHLGLLELYGHHPKQD